MKDESTKPEKAEDELLEDDDALVEIPAEETEAEVEDVQEDAVEPQEDAVEAEPAGKYVGQELTIKTPAGAEFKGLCVSERETNSGGQVFLQLNGLVSRWFSVSDIA